MARPWDHALAGFPPAGPRVTPELVAEAVREYNKRFGQTELDLWREASTFRRAFLADTASDADLRTFAWRVKAWGHIQGVSQRLDDDGALAAGLRLVRPTIVPLAGVAFDRGNEKSISALVGTMVAAIKERGRGRTHFSWASKVLHWILPEHVPVYDAFVRKVLDIRQEGDTAYDQITAWEYGVASSLGESSAFVGSAEPRTRLRALDKFLWWLAETGRRPA